MIIRWRGITNWYETMYIFLGGFGMGIIQSTSFIHLAASLPQNDIAIACTTLYLAQNVFLLIGIQIATTILRTIVRNELETNLMDFEGKAKVSILKATFKLMQVVLLMPHSDHRKSCVKC